MNKNNTYKKFLLSCFTILFTASAFGQISVATYFGDESRLGIGYNITQNLRTEFRIGLTEYTKTDLVLTYAFLNKENFNVYAGAGTGFYGDPKNYKASALVGLEIKPFQKAHGLSLHMELQPFYFNDHQDSYVGGWLSHSWGIRYTFGKRKD